MPAGAGRGRLRARAGPALRAARAAVRPVPRALRPARGAGPGPLLPPPARRRRGRGRRRRGRGGARRPGHGDRLSRRRRVGPRRDGPGAVLPYGALEAAVPRRVPRALPDMRIEPQQRPLRMPAARRGGLAFRVPAQAVRRQGPVIGAGVSPAPDCHPRSKHAQSETASLEGAHGAPSSPRPPEGSRPEPLSQLPRAQASPPGLSALRLLQGQAGDGSGGGLSPDPSRTPRVAVDALGGDHGPRVVAEGAVAAARELGLRVLLVGPEAIVAEELRRAGGGAEIEIADAPEAVGMGERVTRATLKKRSSIQVAVEKLRDGAADAFFSAGNTAACWAIAKMVLGTLEEVDPPAVVP